MDNPILLNSVKNSYELLQMSGAYGLVAYQKEGNWFRISKDWIHFVID